MIYVPRSRFVAYLNNNFNSTSLSSVRAPAYSRVLLYIRASKGFQLIDVNWRSDGNCQREWREEAEWLLRRVSLRTRRLRRKLIGWIRVGILEEMRFQFGVETLG